MRWTGYRTFADRLVLILHVAYAFIPAGFILSALSAFDLIAPSGGIHAWTGGAIGPMTLAVMSRAKLGHTGRRLEASPATHLIYALVIVAALARVCAALEVDHTGARCWRLPALPGLLHFSDLPPPFRWRSGRRAGSDRLIRLVPAWLDGFANS